MNSAASEKYVRNVRTLPVTLGLMLMLLLGMTPLWAQGIEIDSVFGMGGEQIDWGRAITVDHTGNVYVTGRADTPGDFDPDPDVEYILEQEGEDYGFLAKLDEDGTFQWAVRFAVQGVGLAIGPANDVHVISSVGVVYKFDPNGTMLWSQSVGGTPAPWGKGEWAIAVDHSGNVYVSGDERVNIGPENGVSEENAFITERAFLLKFDAGGDFLWGKAIGDYDPRQYPNDVYLGRSIAVGPSGDVCLTGQIRGSIDFATGAETTTLSSSRSAGDPFVLKLDPSGNYRWAKSMPVLRHLSASHIGEGNGVVIDSRGDIYIAGTFWADIDLDPGEGEDIRLCQGQTDAFLVKLDADGTLIWGRTLGDEGWDGGYQIALDAAGDLYFRGDVGNISTLDPEGRTFGNSYGFNSARFIRKMDPLGNEIWTSFVSEDISFVTAFAVGAPDTLFMTGSYKSGEDFDPSDRVLELTSNDSVSLFYDVFVSKSVPDDTAPYQLIERDSIRSPNNYRNLEYHIAFSEIMANFDDASDIEIRSEGVEFENIVVSGGPVIFDVVVEGVTGDGSFSLRPSIDSDISDAAGNLLKASIFTEELEIDHTPPVITMIDPEITTLEAGGPRFRARVNATGYVGRLSDIERSVLPGRRVGRVFHIEHRAYDEARNLATASRILTVVDTRAPIIKLPNNTPEENVVGCDSGEYVEPQLSVVDASDGDIDVVSTGAVDTSTPGNYTLTHTATDESGNTAVAIRIVTVLDDCTRPEFLVDYAQELYRNFGTDDHNRDGLLSFAEAQSRRENLTGGQFLALDANGDYGLSLYELSRDFAGEAGGGCFLSRSVLEDSIFDYLSDRLFFYFPGAGLLR